MFNIIKLCRTTLHMPSWSTILCRQYTDLREYQTMPQYSDIAYIDQNYLAQYVRSSYLMLASDNVLHENPFLTKFRKQVGGFAVASSLNRPAKDQRNRSNFIFDNERPEDQEETNSNQPVIIYNRYLSKEEWKQIYCDYNQRKYYDDNFLSMAIVQFVLQSKKSSFLTETGNELCESNGWHQSPLMQSLLDYITREEEGYTIPQSALIIYCTHCLNKSDHESVVKLFRKIKSRVEVFNSKLLELCISAFRSDFGADYKDFKKFIFPYIKHRIQTKQFSLCSQLAIAAFRHNDLNTALPLMSYCTQYSNNEMQTYDDAMLQPMLHAMRYCKDPKEWSDRQEVVESYFNDRCNRLQYFASKSDVESIALWFKGIKNQQWTPHWKSHDDIMNNGGFCPVTRQKVISYDFTKEELKYLKGMVSKVLMELVHGKSNMYSIKKQLLQPQNSNNISPAKISSITVTFLEFLLQHGPFDVVIDGMNVTCSTNKTSATPGLKVIYSGIKTLKRTRKQPNLKVFLPLPYFLKSHVDEDVPVLNDVADIMYFRNRQIMDDALLLYAALCGNEHCLLLSSDRFRDFKFYVQSSLGKTAAALFVKFQRNRQSYISKYGKVSDPLGTADPILKGESSWHFGYYLNKNQSVNTKYPTHWLCMQRT